MPVRINPSLTQRAYAGDVLVGDGLFLVLWIGLWIYAFIDAITSEATAVRVMPKAIWVILIIIFSGFAAIAWFVFGRPRRGAPRDTTRSSPAPLRWQAGSPFAGTGKRSTSVAPDDNPEFLRQLRSDIHRKMPRPDDDSKDTGPDLPPG